MRAAATRSEPVTWRALCTWLLPTLGAVLTACFALAGWAWHEHTSHPHAGAVTHSELEAVVQRLTTLQEDVREIRADVKRLLESSP